MAATDTETEATTARAEEAGVAEEHHGPTPRQYVKVAGALAALTALEVTISFVEVGVAFIPSLIILMALKFLLVAGWFMHLRFDTSTYSRLMGAGLSLAIVVYGVVLGNLLLHVAAV